MPVCDQVMWCAWRRWDGEGKRECAYIYMYLCTSQVVAGGRVLVCVLGTMCQFVCLSRAGSRQEFHGGLGGYRDGGLSDGGIGWGVGGGVPFSHRI